MNAYPKFGTHPIKCGNSRCAWRGYETGQAKVEKKGGPVQCLSAVRL
jgi:hypothetical protein